MNALTDFADQAVVLPVAAAVLLALLGMGWRRGALAWGVAVGGVLGSMLALKLVALACGARLGWPDSGVWALTSPSGHTAAAAVVYGGLLALLAPRSRGGVAMAACLGGAAAALVGLTRLALGVHTVADVLVGAAVGVAGAMAMRAMAGVRPAGLRRPALLLLAGVMMVAFHGHRLEAETRIRFLATDMWPLSLCRAGR